MSFLQGTRKAAGTLLLAVVSILMDGCGHHESRVAYGNPPVVIISIDTVRADHLPLFGYTKVETPNIDALAKDSILFTNAWSAVPLTFPSHASMLTGLLPPESHVRNNIGYTLDPALLTIPKALKARGYDTGAAVSAYVLRGNLGLGQSFDFYDDTIVSKPGAPVGSLQRSGSETATIAEEWIGAHSGKPFFFLFHVFEPHSPYEPREPYRSRFASAYDGEIATADEIVGGFLQKLKQSAVYDRAIIVLMSDHGEGLYEHGEPEHGIFLYRETLHVPLMIKLPKGERGGERDDAMVSLIDIFPTLAELTGAAGPSGAKGRSLLHHGPADVTRRVYSESLYGRIHLGWGELRSLTGGGYQYIAAPKPELYDLRKDPGELKNVLSEDRRTYASFRDELGEYGSRIELPTQIDPEEARKLAALGYLGGGAAPASGPLPDPKDRIGEIAQMVAAANLMRNGKVDDAVKAFKVIVTQNPRLADAWNQLGDALEAQGRYEEAAAVYKKAIETTPELGGEFGLRLGSVLLKMERFDDAEKHAELGEKTNAGSSHLLRSRIALARKNFRAAEEQARAAAVDPYSRTAATVLLAQTLAQEERAAEALTLIEKVEVEARARHEEPVESLDLVRGDALARMQRYDEAITAFRREIAAFPHDRQAYASMYIVYMLQGKTADGRAALEALVEANPNRRAMEFAAHTAEVLGDTAAMNEWTRRAKGR
jgi:choline-sulfatase